MSYLTDQEIIGAVTRVLARDGRVNLADVIHITAEDGVVRLSGTVPAAGQKKAAEEAIRSVHGVVDIENDLTVAIEGEISDAELRAAVLAGLADSPDLVARVGCRVDGGMVTLVGHIRDAAQAAEAIRIAGAVKGVESVRSALTIAEIVPNAAELPIDDATLLSKLSEALDQAGVYIRDRDLRVNRAVATLRGRVDSEKERQRADAVASAVDGVRGVHNHLVG